LLVRVLADGLLLQRITGDAANAVTQHLQQQQRYAPRRMYTPGYGTAAAPAVDASNSWLILQAPIYEMIKCIFARLVYSPNFL
jgi:hypothetical protein